MPPHKLLWDLIFAKWSPDCCVQHSKSCRIRPLLTCLFFSLVTVFLSSGRKLLLTKSNGVFPNHDWTFSPSPSSWNILPHVPPSQILAFKTHAILHPGKLRHPLESLCISLFQFILWFLPYYIVSMSLGEWQGSKLTCNREPRRWQKGVSEFVATGPRVGWACEHLARTCPV